MPLALTDGQLAQLITATKPLQPAERSAFLAALNDKLDGRTEPLGEGEWFRLLATLQREHFRPPIVGGDRDAPRRKIRA